MDEVLLTHEIRHLEIQMKRDNNTFFDAGISTAPVNNQTVEIKHLVCIIRDITARKEAEAALARKYEEEAWNADVSQGTTRDQY